MNRAEKDRHRLRATKDGKLYPSVAFIEETERIGRAVAREVAKLLCPEDHLGPRRPDRKKFEEDTMPRREWLFTIPGLPVPKGRPRTVHKDRSGRMLKKPHTYTPRATKTYEAKVAALALAAGVRRIPAPRHVGLWVVMYLPEKSVIDGDNVLKVCGDALNGIAYDDDKQVWEGGFRRRTDEEHPRIEVALREVGP